MVTLNEMASGLINHITGVIKDQISFPISMAQIKDDIVSTREHLIIRAAMSKEIPSTECIQTIIIPLNKENGQLVSLMPRFIRTVGLNAITYAGDLNHSFNIQVVFDEQGRYVKHNKYTSHIPTMWITDHKCKYFNLDYKNLTDVYIKGYLRDPRQLKEFNPRKYSDDSIFPISGVIKTQIEEMLIQKYLVTYKDKTEVNRVQAIDEKLSQNRRKG